jgi:hypothetical protein
MPFRNVLLSTAGIVAMLAPPVMAQMVPVKPDSVRAQLSQATQAQGKPAASAAPAKAALAPEPAAKPAAAPAKVAKPATAAASAKTTAAPAGSAKPSGSSAAAAKPVTSDAATVQTAAKQTMPPPASRRDPFDPLLDKNPAQGAPGPDRLPPGKAGLMIGTLRIDGLVHGPSSMIAVVSNPQQRVYFLHEGDRVFDGQVLKITMEAVSFQQTGRDESGKSQEHEVTRRLYPTPGEQR